MRTASTQSGLLETLGQHCFYYIQLQEKGEVERKVLDQKKIERCFNESQCVGLI